MTSCPYVLFPLCSIFLTIIICPIIHYLRRLNTVFSVVAEVAFVLSTMVFSSLILRYFNYGEFYQDIAHYIIVFSYLFSIFLFSKRWF